MYDAAYRTDSGLGTDMYAKSALQWGFDVAKKDLYARRAADVFLKIADVAKHWPVGAPRFPRCSVWPTVVPCIHHRAWHRDHRPWCAVHYGRRALVWPHHATTRNESPCRSPSPSDKTGCQDGYKETFFTDMWLHMDNGSYTVKSSSYSGPGVQLHAQL